MVEDTTGNHISGYLPILDTQMAVRNGRFTLLHYSKPMASLEVTLERSSMSMSSKINILTAEVKKMLIRHTIELTGKVPK